MLPQLWGSRAGETRIRNSFMDWDQWVQVFRYGEAVLQNQAGTRSRANFPLDRGDLSRNLREPRQFRKNLNNRGLKERKDQSQG